MLEECSQPIRSSTESKCQHSRVTNQREERRHGSQKKEKNGSDRLTFFSPRLLSAEIAKSPRILVRSHFFCTTAFAFLRFNSTSVILLVLSFLSWKKKNSPHETLASVSCKVSKVFTLYIVCIVTLVIHTNDTLALVHNYAYNHNVPEGIGAWRDLITYAILCTQIKQRGRRVGGISVGGGDSGGDSGVFNRVHEIRKDFHVRFACLRVCVVSLVV